jgi:hypothetical protein
MKLGTIKEISNALKKYVSMTSRANSYLGRKLNYLVKLDVIRIRILSNIEVATFFKNKEEA